MKADININDVDLHGNADSKGTIGELDANITWTSEGIQETVQNSLPFIGGLVNSVTTDPNAGTIELTGAMGLGGVTVKPQVTDGAADAAGLQGQRAGRPHPARDRADRAEHLHRGAAQAISTGHPGRQRAGHQ